MLLDIPIVKADQVNAEFPEGTGPYLLEERGGVKQLRRQAAWWTEAACVATAATISLIDATSINQIRDSFEFGSLDLVCADPGNENYADYRCDYEVWDCDSGILLYLVCHSDSWLFSDPTLRRALTHAIDRNALVENFYHGFATATTLPADPGSPFYNTSLANRYGYDPDAFAEAMKNANVPEDEVAVFAVNGDDALRVRVAEYLTEVLTEAGLQIRLEKVPEKKFKAFLEEGKFDLYLGQTKLSPNMDLTAFFAENGSLSYGDLDNTAMLALNQKALANIGNFYNLHEQIMANGNLIPILTHSYAIYATRGVVTELTPARDHIFYYSTGRRLSDALITD
jgi:peptide/nickel transport system substrate-binding protein